MALKYNRTILKVANNLFVYMPINLVEKLIKSAYK